MRHHTRLDARTALRGRSVRSHLVGIVVAVTVVFVVVSGSAAVVLVRETRSDARHAAAYQAGIGAEAIDSTIALATTQIATVAGNPSVAGLLTSNVPCPLTFRLALLPGSHLDLVRPDGSIACTSAKGTTPATTHRGTGWLTEAGTTDEVVRGRPFADAVTGEQAIAIALGVAGSDGARVGAVAVVIPTAPIAEQLAREYGGPNHVKFRITDTTDDTTLSRASAFPSESFSADRRVESLGWRLRAAIPTDTAMGPARSQLLRVAAAGLAVLLVLIASFALLYRRIARPLRQLSRTVTATGAHAANGFDAIRGPREILELAEHFRQAVLARDDHERQLSEQALHDPLTGLPNRLLLAERLKHTLEQCERTERQVAVLFLDLDRFKLINDSLGHAAGDEVLRVVASRLARAIRPGDTLARFGGDEFVLVTEGIAHEDQVNVLARRLSDVLDTPLEVADTTVRVTASVGIALSTAGRADEDLIRDADTAMYVSKQRGGACHELFDRRLGQQVSSRLVLENELRLALERRQLHVVYQPKIDLLTGEAVGVEALLRWEHPTLGAVSPVTFIPVAEETGLIVPIGRFVLTEACRQVVTWKDEGIAISVAVNVSGRQLADPELVDDVSQVLADTGLEPEWLCLELTESVLMHDTLLTAVTLERLHDLGVKLSIDDFGTGYSSLGYLHRFPVDELKIDRVFVNDLTEHPNHGTLVAAMVAMGKTLGLHLVAEGVETDEQANRLRVLGCDTAQGYLFARPQPADELTGLLRELAPGHDPSIR